MTNTENTLESLESYTGINPTKEKGKDEPCTKKNELMHYGVSKNDGAKLGSGRYPLGSGDRPHQHDGQAAVSRKSFKQQAKERKEGIKANKDANRDFYLLKNSLDENRTTARDASSYYKRHSHQQKSLVSNIISKHGGIKVTKEYADTYKASARDMIDTWRKMGYDEAKLRKIEEKLTDTKFRVNRNDW